MLGKGVISSIQYEFRVLAEATQKASVCFTFMSSKNPTLQFTLGV